MLKLSILASKLRKFLTLATKLSGFLLLASLIDLSLRLCNYLGFFRSNTRNCWLRQYKPRNFCKHLNLRVLKVYKGSKYARARNIFQVEKACFFTLYKLNKAQVSYLKASYFLKKNICKFVEFYRRKLSFFAFCFTIKYP